MPKSAYIYTLSPPEISRVAWQIWCDSKVVLDQNFRLYRCFYSFADTQTNVSSSATIRAYMPPTPPADNSTAMKVMNDIIANYMPPPPAEDNPWPVAAMPPQYAKPSTASPPPLFSDRAIATNAHGHSDKDMPSVPTFLPASRLRYSLRGGRPVCLGAGSFGEVYVVSLEGVEKPVCVKVFTERSRETDHSILVEAAKLMALNGCDSTPWCYGVVGLTDCPGYKRLGIVMEFIGDPLTLRTMTLRDLLITLEKRPGNLPEPDWTTFAKTLATKLQRVHQRGIVINDLKEDNVMLRWCENTWDPVLIDVGQACYRDRRVHYGILPCKVEKALQDYPQLAPELLEKDISCEKSDVYSLGRVLCRIAHICGSQNMWMLGRVCRVRGLEDRLDLTAVLYFLRQVQASRDGWTSHGVEQGAYRSVKDKISSMIFNIIVSIKLFLQCLSHDIWMSDGLFAKLCFSNHRYFNKAFAIMIEVGMFRYHSRPLTSRRYFAHHQRLRHRYSRSWTHQVVGIGVVDAVPPLFSNLCRLLTPVW